MSTARQVASNFMQEHVVGRLDLSDDAEAKLQDALTSWFDGAYAAERERCGALLGSEAMDLIAQGDPDEASIVARCSMRVRNSGGT
jgi:hypothetical protein